MYIKIISLFEPLAHLSRIIIQFYLHEKVFTITYFLYYYSKYTTTWVVNIELVPIQKTSVQSLGCVYFYIIACYLNILKRFLGVTRSTTRNICAEFGINFSHIFLLLSLYI